MTRLVTLQEWQTLPPRQQGYVSYMQAELSGSELKNHQTNPYKSGTPAFRAFEEGVQRGVLEAQDSEE